MKLFKDSKGFIFSFGFDVRTGKQNENIVQWCDPVTKDWNLSPANQAGWINLDFTVDPEFIFETINGIVAYQPGKCVVLNYVGGNMVWNTSVLVAND